eukprot:sb/3473894/
MFEQGVWGSDELSFTTLVTGYGFDAKLPSYTKLYDGVSSTLTLSCDATVPSGEGVVVTLMNNDGEQANASESGGRVTLDYAVPIEYESDDDWWCEFNSSSDYAQTNNATVAFIGFVSPPSVASAPYGGDSVTMSCAAYANSEASS